LSSSTNKTSELASSAITVKLKSMDARVKTLAFDNGKEFVAYAHIDEQLQSTSYFDRPFAVGNLAAISKFE